MLTPLCHGLRDRSSTSLRNEQSWSLEVVVAIVHSMAIARACGMEAAHACPAYRGSTVQYAKKGLSGRNDANRGLLDASNVMGREVRWHESIWGSHHLIGDA